MKRIKSCIEDDSGCLMWSENSNNRNDSIAIVMMWQ